MKLSRLMTYATIGIIAGLLAENNFLIFKGKAKDTTGKVKKKMGKLIHPHQAN